MAHSIICLVWISTPSASSLASQEGTGLPARTLATYTQNKHTHTAWLIHRTHTKNMSRIKAMCRSKCTNPSLIVYTFTPVGLNDKRVEEGNDHVFCNITCKNMRLTLTYPHVATFLKCGQRENRTTPPQMQNILPVSMQICRSCYIRKEWVTYDL